VDVNGGGLYQYSLLMYPLLKALAAHQPLSPPIRPPAAHAKELGLLYSPSLADDNRRKSSKKA
jgi:hypothetical protein